MKEKEKFKIQDELYSFPYHYLAYIEDETPYIKRTINWALNI